MGIAKTINAIGEYDFYSPDYHFFAKTISMLFKVNLNINFLAYINEEKTDYDKTSEFLYWSNK